ITAYHKYSDKYYHIRQYDKVPTDNDDNFIYRFSTTINSRGLIPSRGFGDFRYKNLSTVEPEIVHTHYQINDLIIMASDGFWDVFEPNEVMILINQYLNKTLIINNDTICEYLVDIAIRRG